MASPLKPVRNIPLPVKIFFSYLLVVSAGALPTYMYLRQLFETQLMADSAMRVATHAQLLGTFLSEMDVHHRLEELRHIAPTAVERVTYINAAGRVLFDSATYDLHSMENHLDRPEVHDALGRSADSPSFDPHLPRVGVSRRPSDDSNIDTLYVAVCIQEATPKECDFVRLSIPIAEIQRLANSILRAFRNSQAAAVSIAIIMSMLGAVLFMRPLQKLGSAALALAGGDYTVTVDVQGQDEVGEVGRALEHLGRELRRRMAVAQAGEAMIVQLVNGIGFPMAIFGPEGRVVAANEAARTLFEGSSGGDDNLTGFALSEPYKKATEDADAQGEPVRLIYRPAPRARPVRGWVHVLKHPIGPPFFAFLGEAATRDVDPHLPRPPDLQPLPLPALMEVARQRPRGYTLSEAVAAPNVLLSDAQGRLGLAVGVVVEALLPEGKPSVAVSHVVKASRVLLTFHAAGNEPIVGIANGILKPIGGYAKIRNDKCVVALPRA
jgi:HAMP domain-containing protein